MALVLVENSWEPPIDRETLLRGDEGLHACLQEREVRWVRSYLSADGRQSLCHFEAPDADSVREAYRRSELSVGKIWSADLIEP